MFEIPVGELIDSLERLGANLCAYRGGDWRTRRCDCKYGYDPKHGEMTGCPEIRLVVQWLQTTPEPGDEAHLAADRRQAASILRGFGRQAIEFADELSQVGPGKVEPDVVIP